MLLCPYTGTYVGANGDGLLKKQWLIYSSYEVETFYGNI